MDMLVGLEGVGGWSPFFDEEIETNLNAQRQGETQSIVLMTSSRCQYLKLPDCSVK